MTDIRTIIAELRELEAKATPGEWSVFVCDDGKEHSGWPLSINAQVAPHSEDSMCVVRPGGFFPYSWDPAMSIKESNDNAALIAASRNVLPLLLDYIARLEVAAKSLDEVTEVLAANDKGPGSGWFAPCLSRARKALKAVGY